MTPFKGLLVRSTRDDGYAGRQSKRRGSIVHAARSAAVSGPRAVKDAILVINAGSSSIKFAVFTLVAPGGGPERLHAGEIEGIGQRARFLVADGEGRRRTHERLDEAMMDVGDHAQALRVILDWLDRSVSDLSFVAAGHRVVHGATRFREPVQVDAAILEQLRALSALAPLHQPHALHAIDALMSLRPAMRQVACFDTAFHSSMPAVEQTFALPRRLTQQGVRRYGFHGLSYEHIARVLPDHLGAGADGRIIVAHLGHGVSLCAMRERRSLATSMSFTPLDGVPMGTRSGALDPAVVLYLMREERLSESEISDLLHHQSGLLGVSGISGDMRELLASERAESAEAVSLFVHCIAREIGSLTAVLGGLDAIVFTGGIGEHAVEVRERICRGAAWLGVVLDQSANRLHGPRISTSQSPVSVWVIPTDEEQAIAMHTAALVGCERGKPAP